LSNPIIDTIVNIPKKSTGNKHPFNHPLFLHCFQHWNKKFLFSFKVI
jgi:hypothetical protein